MTIILGKIDLKYNDFLQPETTRIRCIACQNVGLSTVRHESVTCLQRFVAFTNICKNWNNRYDINHYCTQCGCFLGRCMRRDDQGNGRDQLKTKKTSKNWEESLIRDLKEKRKNEEKSANKERVYFFQQKWKTVI